MGKSKIRGKELEKMGYPSGRSIGLAIQQVLLHYQREDRDVLLKMFREVLNEPLRFESHPVLGGLVKELKGEERLKEGEFALRPVALDFPVYGKEYIEKGATEQMRTAMSLPVACKGALMPDAHQGYGLPIGGVLATQNAVIPYGVGVDIGCRMCLSVFPIPVSEFTRKPERLSRILQENTRFGIDEFDRPMDDEVLHLPDFSQIKLLREMKKKAADQIGTSGSGNHFVEFGPVHLSDPGNEWNLPVGDYFGLLSHSGSRNLGANIARHYTRIAMETCVLPKNARHLAWLSLDEEAGMEYWKAMNIAGLYASANHAHIHFRIARALGEEPLFRVENHHNFAWKERLEDGTEVVVHRKGATPAHKGVLGIIPGSMTLPGFIVRGKGVPDSVNSASHGAGRLLSRTEARNCITRNQLSKILESAGVTLIGGDLDEAPIAYKNIWDVMDAQKELVEIIGAFQPRIVRMDQ